MINVCSTSTCSASAAVDLSLTRQCYFRPTIPTDQLSFPISSFLKTSVAVKIQESRIPATVNVPPTMAQTYDDKTK